MKTRISTFVLVAASAALLSACSAMESTDSSGEGSLAVQPFSSPPPVSSPSATQSPTLSPSPTVQPSPSASPTPSPTVQPTPSTTPSPSSTPSPSATPAVLSSCNVPAPTPPVAAATYYFAANGNDANDGLTPATAKRSLSLLPGMAGDAAPGTHFLLRRGDTFVTTAGLTFYQANGTPSAPIVVGAYGSGTNPIIDAHTNAGIITVRGADSGESQYLWFDSLTLTTTQPSGLRPSTGIFTGESWYSQMPHHLTFSNVTVDGVMSGVVLYSPDTLFTHSRVINNFGLPGEEGFTQGLFGNAPRLVIRNTFSGNNGRRESWFDHGNYLGGPDNQFVCNVATKQVNPLKVRRAQRILVAQNLFYDVPVAIIAGGDSDGGIDGLKIVGNTFIQTSLAINIKSQSGVGVGNIDFLIANNLILDSGATWSPSWFFDNGYQVTVDNSQTANGNIVNNLFYGSTGPNVVVNNPGTITVANNVLSRLDSSNAALVTASPQVTITNNLSYTTAAAFAGLSVVSTAGTDPFAWDFHLTSGSTQAIDAGINTSTLWPYDFDGNPRLVGAAVDIGPFERP